MAEQKREHLFAWWSNEGIEIRAFHVGGQIRLIDVEPMPGGKPDYLVLRRDDHSEVTRIATSFDDSGEQDGTG